MFFDEITDIEKIGRKNGCTIFLVPDSVDIKIKNAILVKPEEKASITVEQMRNLVESFTTKQLEDRMVVIRPAELLSDVAESSILKSLEEPKENLHYLLITEQPHRLLPTIRSRAGTYVWRGNIPSFNEVSGDAKTKELAKEILSAKPRELPAIAEKLTKKKDNVRASVLKVLSVAVEMSYKTYILTGKEAYLKKSEKLINAYDSIAANGHIKLHLVADLI